jgi:hypothetical protein
MGLAIVGEGPSSSTTTELWLMRDGSSSTQASQHVALLFISFSGVREENHGFRLAIVCFLLSFSTGSLDPCL